MEKVKSNEFKKMFSDYCREQVNAGICTDGDCQWCCVNQAYEKIFNDKNNEEDDDE